jgi:uncharacterized damage-inducible protein DinB
MYLSGRGFVSLHIRLVFAQEACYSSVVPQLAAEVTMSISEMLLPEFDQEMANTRKMLERVPEDKLDYKPHEKSMTLGRLAAHTAEMVGWVTTVISTESLALEPGMEPLSPKSRKELLDGFDKSVAEARAAIVGATDEHLAKIWTLIYAGKTVFSIPRAAVLRGMVMNHIIHHRAQLSVYLRLNDVEIPGMYGPSADDMKYWQTAQA